MYTTVINMFLCFYLKIMVSNSEIYNISATLEELCKGQFELVNIGLKKKRRKEVILFISGTYSNTKYYLVVGKESCVISIKIVWNIN